MRILKVASYYGVYARSFYAKKPELKKRPYLEQLSAFLADCFSWADFYDAPLEKLGYETIEIIRDVEPLQRAWAREHSLQEGLSLEEITVAQIIDAKPDVLWFEDSSTSPPLILHALEQAGARPPLVLGWTGSFVPDTEAYAKVDLTLSCAPETVEHLRSRGAAAEHLDHAFSPLVLDRMTPSSPLQDLAFFGHIMRSDGFHRERTEVLSEIASSGGHLKIYTPQLVAGTTDPLKLALRSVKIMALFPAKLAVYGTAWGLQKIGVPRSLLARNRYLRRAFELDGLPKVFPPPNDIPNELLPFAVPPVFGLDMYVAVAQSRIVLNVHADSSPRYASNMRLYEVTGAGSLLLTDWRDNLPDLFDPENEVVAYRSVDECIEKISWLVDHEEERSRIAAAGQARCLRDHNFDVRAERLDSIIKKALR